MLDLYDCKKETPYTIEEILTDKVWRVGYKMQHTIPRPEAKKMAKFMGMAWRPMSIARRFWPAQARTERR